MCLGLGHLYELKLSLDHLTYMYAPHGIILDKVTFDTFSVEVSRGNYNPLCMTSGSAGWASRTLRVTFLGLLRSSQVT